VQQIPVRFHLGEARDTAILVSDGEDFGSSRPRKSRPSADKLDLAATIALLIRHTTTASTFAILDADPESPLSPQSNANVTISIMNVMDRHARNRQFRSCWSPANERRFETATARGQ